jgi:hypothetical protein
MRIVFALVLTQLGRIKTYTFGPILGAIGGLVVQFLPTAFYGNVYFRKTTINGRFFKSSKSDVADDTSNLSNTTIIRPLLQGHRDSRYPCG